MQQTDTITFTSGSGLLFGEPVGVDLDELPSLLCPSCGADRHSIFHLDRTTVSIECPNEHRFHHAQV
ncbi:hypothetical protein [Streptomyces sp. NPDC002851]